MTKCNWCGSPGACIPGCLCEKCINPANYNNNWKFNDDGTFTEKYKNWRIKEKIKYLEKENQTLKSANQNLLSHTLKLESTINYTDDLERCPICKHEYDNVHIVQVVVNGATLFVLDGVHAKQIFDKEYVFSQTGSRGTDVYVCFHSEHCDHFWYKQIWFRKGETRTETEILTETELKKLGWIKKHGEDRLKEGGYNVPECWRD